jgi:hypothetical protein
VPASCLVYSLLALALVLSVLALTVSLSRRRRSIPPPPAEPPTLPVRFDAAHDPGAPAWGATPAEPIAFAPAERHHDPDAVTRPDPIRVARLVRPTLPDAARTLSQQRDDLAAAIEADARRLRASAESTPQPSPPWPNPDRGTK